MCDTCKKDECICCSDCLLPIVEDGMPGANECECGLCSGGCGNREEDCECECDDCGCTSNEQDPDCGCEGNCPAGCA
jgi:hypothetical protein